MAISTGDGEGFKNVDELMEEMEICELIAGTVIFTLILLRFTTEPGLLSGCGEPLRKYKNRFYNG